MIETLVAVAVGAIVMAAVLGALVTSLHHSAPDPVRTRLREFASSELAIAVNLAKYQGSTLVPAAIATALPMPAGSPMPVAILLETTDAGNGATTLTVSAAANQANEAVSLTATVMARAPQPNAKITIPGLAPAPTGAP